MAVTQTHTNLAVIKWRKDVYQEFRRGNLFSPYMGEGPTSVIQILRELRDGGDRIIVPLVGALRGPGVSTGPLTGNEEKMDQYGWPMWIDWARNAVLLTRAQMRKSAIEQLEFVRPLLTDWGQALQRDEIVLAMHSLPSESPPANWGNEATAGQRVNGTIFELATAAQRNKFLADNSDRIVFGKLVGNQVAGNMAASLGNLDATDDRPTSDTLMLKKRIARRALPGITPFKTSETKGREYFVEFCGSNAFRDYANDPKIYQANKDARAREGDGMDDNPLFQDGDLLYRGVIVREIPEIDDLCPMTGMGAGGTVDVTPTFMCGQNALAMPWGQMPRPTERKEDDYQFLIGRGVEMVYGVGKVVKKQPSDDVNGKLVQWGLVTGYYASVPDA